MAKLLLNLKYVLEEEYHNVCELLEENELAYYETTVGFWGLGIAGIWLVQDDDYPKARLLLDELMAKQASDAREAYQKAIEADEHRTWWKTIRHHPISVVLIFVAIGLLAALTLLPFLYI